MNRRNFLKTLAAGVTIPVIAKIEAASGSELLQQISESNVTEKHDIEDKYIHIDGGYDEYDDYYWFRFSIQYKGKEWHNLVRTSFQEENERFARIADITNHQLKLANIPYRINELQVKEAFYAK